MALREVVALSYHKLLAYKDEYEVARLHTGDEIKKYIGKKLKKNYPIAIKATFLGAHALPTEYKNRKDEYLKEVIDTILPQVTKEKLADFIDIFCGAGGLSYSFKKNILKINIHLHRNNYLIYK